MDRLDAIVSLIENADVVADIGTDHGYVCEKVLNEKRAKSVIASDINKMPLESAIKNLTDAGYKEMCDFRLGAGLEVIDEGEVDLAVIAGMGGELISAILDKDEKVSRSVNKFILQPMQNIDKLRTYLHEHEYKISKEVIVKEAHRYYFIMLVESGKSDIKDDIFMEVSEYLFKQRDLLFKEYLIKREKELNVVFDNLSKSKSADSIEKKDLILSKIRKFKELIGEYEV